LDLQRKEELLPVEEKISVSIHHSFPLLVFYFTVSRVCSVATGENDAVRGLRDQVGQLHVPELTEDHTSAFLLFFL